jgi:NADPH:quinone reductase-like Zn-dependent oxidoreductase
VGRKRDGLGHDVEGEVWKNEAGVTRDGDDAGVNCVGMDVSTLGGYFECAATFSGSLYS